MTAGGRVGAAGAAFTRPVWWLVPVLLLLAGCTAAAPTDTQTPEVVAPFLDCAMLTTPPSPGSAGTGSGGAVGPGADLPDVTLPCFTGGLPVRLAELRGPAVLNLWGTWCGPCRTELPAVQRLADRTVGRLHVVGVSTRDGRPAAASFAVDKNVTMPTLYDLDQQLMAALGKIGLPVTVFIDAAGDRHVYNGAALDDVRLAELVTEHTGVTVQP